MNLVTMGYYTKNAANIWKSENFRAQKLKEFLIIQITGLKALVLRHIVLCMVRSRMKRQPKTWIHVWGGVDGCP